MSEPARQMQVNPEDGTPEETVIALAKQRGYVTRKNRNAAWYGSIIMRTAAKEND